MPSSFLKPGRSTFLRPELRTLRVLLVDDTADERQLRAALADFEPLEVHRASCPANGLELLAGPLDLVIAELGTIAGQELEILSAARAVAPGVPVMIVTGRGNEHWATEAMKRGAADYLAKTAGYLDQLGQRVREALARQNPPTNGHSRLEGDNVAAYGRILDALPVHLALLDEHGVIRGVNAAWSGRPFENPYQSVRHATGVNYLDVCDAASRKVARQTADIGEGLRGVLAGTLSVLSAEYCCQDHGRERWYKLMACPLRDVHHRGAMILHVDITDRKRAEHERDQLSELSMSMLCIGGFDGYMKRWNPTIQKVLGHSEQEAMSTPLVELIHPDDREQMARMGMRLLQGERVWGVEARVRTGDGGYKSVLWEAVPDLEKGLYFANGQDITARKEAEQRLQESNRRFEWIAAATNEALWDWDLRENRLWQNDSYLQMLGTFDPERETVVEWWRRRIHPDDRERILASVPRHAVDGQQKWVLEYRIERQDGSYASVYDRGFVIFGEAGEPIRMVGSIIDVSQIRFAEQKLRESEERFRLAAKATSDAIWDWDLKRDLVWRSKGFETLFGYRPEEIAPSQSWWMERIHPDDRDRIMSQLPSAERGDAQCAFEYRFRRADGSYADVFDRGFRMCDADGKPTRMVGSMMDVSERRRTEDLARLHQAELAHMSRLNTMGEIATGIAHELNQPLTAISNYAESCARAVASGSPAEGKLLDWIEKIAVNTHRAAEMIRGLRSFTRKSEPTRAEVEIGELVQEVLDLLESETRFKSVRVTWNRGAEANSAVDRIQIQQVLVNLLSNAYDAMARNHPDDRRVKISVCPGRESVEISVEDCGEGIPPENLERVFDAFFTSKSSGMGIGLAISRSIVEDHGGRLWVRSNPRRGVTFTFSLPLSGA